MDEYRCRVCWTTFDGPGDLAAHEQDEEDAGFPWPLLHAPSKYGPTRCVE